MVLSNTGRCFAQLVTVRGFYKNGLVILIRTVFFYCVVVILGVAFSQIYNKDGSLIDFENVPYTLEQIPNPQEYDALEATLLYLLGGLETWGSWLDPANNVGLLPEAEGRFMTSSTPILQIGTNPSSIDRCIRFCWANYY